MDNWDPAAADYYNPGYSIMRNNGPASTYVRMNGEPEQVEAYITHIPLGMTEIDLRTYLGHSIRVLSVKIFTPKFHTKYSYHSQQKLSGIAKLHSIRDLERLISDLHQRGPLHLNISKALSREERSLRNQGKNLTDFNQSNKGPKKKALISTPSKQPTHLPNSNQIPQQNSQKDSSPKLSDSSKAASKESLVEMPNTNGFPDRSGSERSDRENSNAPRPRGRGRCILCKTENSQFRCSSCFCYYCSTECRNDDWVDHQSICKPPPPLISCEEKPKESNSFGRALQNESQDRIDSPSTQDFESLPLPTPTSEPKTTGSQRGGFSPRNRGPFKKSANQDNRRENSNYVQNENSATRWQANDHSQKRGILGPHPQQKQLHKPPQSNVSGTFPLSDHSFLKIKLQYEACITEVDFPNFKVIVNCNQLSKDVIEVDDHLEEELQWSNLDDGQFCAAYSDTFKSWFRAFILTHNTTSAEVCFIDFGTVETVKKLRALPSSFISNNVPAHSLFCTVLDSVGIDKKIFEVLKIDNVVKLRVDKKNDSTLTGSFLDDSGTAICHVSLKPWSEPYLKSISPRCSLEGDASKDNKSKDHILELQKNLSKAEHFLKEKPHQNILPTEQQNKKPQMPHFQAPQMGSPPMQPLLPPRPSLGSTPSTRLASPQKIKIEAQTTPAEREKFFKDNLRVCEVQANKSYNVVPVCLTESEMWFHLSSNSEVKTGMNNKCSNFAPNAPIPTGLKPKELVITLLKEDGCWYRAEVLSVNNDTVKVFFIDYGNEDTIPLEDTRQFIPALSSIPILAIQVPFPNNMLNLLESDRAEFIDNFNDKIITLEELRLDVTSLNPIQGSLFDQQGNKLFEGQPQASHQTSSDNVPRTVRYCDSNRATLSIGETEVMVLSVDAFSGDINVLPKNHFETIGTYETEVAPEIQDYCNSKTNHYYEPQLDIICLAKFSEDNLWYRAACLDIDEAKKSAKVKFVDYGNTEDVPFTNICQMIRKFMRIPLLAVPCILIGLPQRSEEIFAEVTRQITGKVQSIEVVEILEGEIFKIKIASLLEDLKKKNIC